MVSFFPVQDDKLFPSVQKEKLFPYRKEAFFPYRRVNFSPCRGANLFQRYVSLLFANTKRSQNAGECLQNWMNSFFVFEQKVFENCLLFLEFRKLWRNKDVFGKIKQRKEVWFGKKKEILEN